MISTVSSFSRTPRRNIFAKENPGPKKMYYMQRVQLIAF